jgi:hypothetical protein
MRSWHIIPFLSIQLTITVLGKQQNGKEQEDTYVSLLLCKRQANIVKKVTKDRRKINDQTLNIDPEMDSKQKIN